MVYNYLLTLNHSLLFEIFILFYKFYILAQMMTSPRFECRNISKWKRMWAIPKILFKFNSSAHIKNYHISVSHCKKSKESLQFWKKWINIWKTSETSDNMKCSNKWFNNASFHREVDAKMEKSSKNGLHWSLGSLKYSYSRTVGSLPAIHSRTGSYQKFLKLMTGRSSWNQPVMGDCQKS